MSDRETGMLYLTYSFHGWECIRSAQCTSQLIYQYFWNAGHLVAENIVVSPSKMSLQV